MKTPSLFSRFLCEVGGLAWEYRYQNKSTDQLPTKDLIRFESIQQKVADCDKSIPK